MGVLTIKEHGERILTKHTEEYNLPCYKVLLYSKPIELIKWTERGLDTRRCRLPHEVANVFQLLLVKESVHSNKP